MAQNRVVVNSKNGVAQWRPDEQKVFILFKRYTVFLNDDEISELIHLLETIQQEIDLKQANEAENLPTLAQIAERLS